MEVDKLKIKFRRNYYIKELVEARENLKKLKKMIIVEDKLYKQFILLYESLLNKKDIGKGEFIKLLYQAIRYTIPNFNIDIIEEYLLSQEEIVIISNIALTLRELGEKEKALCILTRLKKYLESPRFDYEEKVRTYPVIVYNLSKWQGMEGMTLECIATTQKGIDFCVKHDIASILAYLLFNKGYALMQIKSTELALESIKQSYYILIATNQIVAANRTKDYVKEHFGDINL